MSDFKANMHQIRFRSARGSLQRFPKSLAGLEGPASNGEGGEIREGTGREGRAGKGVREGRRKVREGRGGRGGERKKGRGRCPLEWIPGYAYAAKTFSYSQCLSSSCSTEFYQIQHQAD